MCLGVLDAAITGMRLMFPFCDSPYYGCKSICGWTHIDLIEVHMNF